MELLIGITGPDYVLVASDQLNIGSIVVRSRDHDKLHHLGPHQLLGIIGDGGEADRLREQIVAKHSLSFYRTNRSWTTAETAQFSRSLVADSLRTRAPHQANVMIAGVHKTSSSCSSSLYWMDHLASLHKLPYGVHGYGGYFVWGLLDSRYHPDMSLDEAVQLLKLALHELQKRFVVQIPRLGVKVVDQHGIHDLAVDWEISQLMVK